jgi:hypothetical protein
MRELAAASWDLYREAIQLGTHALVRPSIPILFFGDDERYAASALKVVTVGLNPSRLEFPSADPFLRFPAARQIDPQRPALDAHLAALRAYFRERPYNAWFRPAFEPILNGLATSYYPGTANTALHTDICSPLATDPTCVRRQLPTVIGARNADAPRQVRGDLRELPVAANQTHGPSRRYLPWFAIRPGARRLEFLPVLRTHSRSPGLSRL